MMDSEALPLIVRRLLGPLGPEVTCETCFAELDHYVELELTDRDAEAAVPGMRAHLDGCPACAEEHASLAALLRSQADLGWSPRHDPR